MQPILVKMIPLKKAGLDGYAEKILPGSGSAPDSSGEGWACWFPAAELDNTPGKQIGQVRTAAGKQVMAMEMHPYREETVFAIQAPVIQVLALPHPELNAPDPASLRAVILEPGQGLRVLPGVWHAVGLPYHDPVTAYWFILNQPTARDQAAEIGWTGFPGEVYAVLVDE